MEENAIKKGIIYIKYRFFYLRAISKIIVELLIVGYFE